jgi:hypothetical protein
MTSAFSFRFHLPNRDREPDTGVNIRRLIILFFVAWSVAPGVMNAQERYFYTGKDFGSEALYNPVNLLLNGSFDIIQLDGHEHRIANYPYATLFRHVWWNATRPLAVVNEYGWGQFLKNEVFPVEITRKGAQWWPNYQLHLVGGGMTYVAMKEWYEAHGFPSPRLCSAATMAAYHVLNEVVEAYPTSGDVSGLPSPTVDPIADLFIFDLGGVVLFSFDGVSEFFSRTLNMADWSLQPSFTLAPPALYNNGQYFSFKWRIPFWERWHVFYLTGMNGLMGLSYKDRCGATLSVGLGLRAKRLEQVQNHSAQQTADLVWNAGIFLDVENSLLASLFLSGLTQNTVTLNIYPGLFRVNGISPGCWISVNRDGSLMGGVVTRFVPGLAWK